MRPKFSNFDSLQRPLMASEVNQLRQSFIRTPRAFRNGMTLAYWIKIEVSRASRSFESDLTRFSEKVEASRTASFRGQEIFPMVSGDVPRYTKEVLRKKSKFIFLTLQPLSQISKTSPSVNSSTQQTSKNNILTQSQETKTGGQQCQSDTRSNCYNNSG